MRGKSRQLDSTVAALQKRFGPQAIRKGVNATKVKLPPSLTTGFAQLDAITGCNGVPLHAITLLTGQTTSGKLTLAYKMLAQVHSASRRYTAAILDLNRSTDPDYLVRCGVDLDRLLLVQPNTGNQAIGVLRDLLRTRYVRAIVVDSLADLTTDNSTNRAFNAALPAIQALLGQTPCAVVVLDEPRPPWHRFFPFLERSALRQVATLHLELRREQAWVQQRHEVVGYRAQACVTRSRWARSGATTTIEIVFNGTVRAAATW